jgi:hypothetical protein
VWDFKEDDDSMKDMGDILDLIFKIVIPMIQFLCGFSLSASMSANLYQ